MIELSTIAEMFETGLNAALTDKNLQFKIWSDLGEYIPPERTGNSVQYTLLGSLTATSSANTTASGGLVLGMQSMTLEFRIPQLVPRTTPDTAQRGGYKFVKYIRKLLDNYFAANKVFGLTDNGVTYRVSLAYGTAISGIPGIDSPLGKSYGLSVYITMLYGENGINSRDITIQFDGVPINFETANPSRAATVSTDIYAGNSTAKNIVTSTAFSIDCTIPSTTNEVTAQFVSYLLNGAPNTAHFVKVNWGGVDEKIFLMTQKDISASISGVEIAGLTMPLIEVADNVEMMNYPASFFVAKIRLTSDNPAVLVTQSDCIYYFAGEIAEASGGSQIVKMPRQEDMVYDEATDTYSAYFISTRPVSAGSSFTEITIVQEGENA